MKKLKKIPDNLDRWQQKHPVVAFPVAVIKQYGDDETGYKAALFTYYAFLSLFPLLLIVTTLVNVLVGSYDELRAEIIKSFTDYFPVLGNQLSSHVGTLKSAGPALIVALLFSLYGARGVADAFRHGVQDIWQVPRKDRPGFPKSVLNSFAIIIVGGAGFILAAASSSVAGAAGHGWDFRLLATVINLAILFLVFSFLLNICLPKHITFRDIRPGAITAAVGLVILQSIGGLILARELRNLDALYSYFALSLGLLFWIYLQAQVVFYAIEIAAVSAKRQWPRSFTGNHPTPADKQRQD